MSECDRKLWQERPHQRATLLCALVRGKMYAREMPAVFVRGCRFQAQRVLSCFWFVLSGALGAEVRPVASSRDLPPPREREVLAAKSGCFLLAARAAPDWGQNTFVYCLCFAGQLSTRSKKVKSWAAS